MTRKTKLISFLLCFAILVGMMPLSAFAYWEEPTADGNTALETTVYDYTQPVGVTMQRLTGNCQTEVDNLGDDFLFVIKSGDRYYAMKDVAAREEQYESIPAVDVTAWVNQDGTLTVPADTLDVAFWRYEERPTSELGVFINGRENYLSYTYDFESADGDEDYYNDTERTYTGAFKISTFENGEYITYEPYYWSENGVSGTLKFNGSWSYFFNNRYQRDIRYELIADLRDNGNNGKEFYFRYLGTDVEYTGEEVEGYYYYTDCRHQFTIRHAEYDAPTCMLKGCEEYWYCEGCNFYFKDATFQERFGQQMPIIPAIGHDWGSEKCANCDRPVPVYSKVTNQAQFDALAKDTMYILVAEYNGKYYVPDLAELCLYMTDSDGDGYFDIHDIDENGNGIPDYLEFDEGPDAPNGILDYLEWDMDNDGDVDENDHLEFHKMICSQHLTDMLYTNGGVNATEVTMNPDGTFSHEAVKSTIEFEMVDVYLPEDYDPDFHEHWVNGEMPYHTKCIKQFAIPNIFISAPSMCPIERMYQQRIYDFGDSSSWGVVFYDNRNDYYYYPDGNVEQKTSPLNFLDINKDDSVAVFDTFDDIMWVYYDEGQLGQFRLRDYNGNISFVTGHDYELDGYEWVSDESNENGGYYDTHDTQACVYLYASAQYNSHTCNFGDWVNDDNGRTHTRTCKDSECGKTETKSHVWDNGVETQAPTCIKEGVMTFTCNDCRATKTEDIAALNHDWNAWTDDGINAPADTHSRTCKRNCGVIAESGTHNWSSWTPDDDTNHTKTCSVCSGTRTDTHNWDDGVVINWATHLAPGEIHFSCADCGYVKIGTQPALEEHEWTDWTDNNDGTHSRACLCNASETAAHTWSNWAIQNDGSYMRECTDCDASETMSLPENKPINITTNENAANTNLINTDIELIENILTDEEQSQVAAGTEVKVYLKVEDISNTAPATHKAEAEAKAGDNEIGMYLDIDLFKQVGTSNEIQVTETSGKVTITITIPEELINTNASVTRTYKIIRVHDEGNGILITDVIDGIFNAENNTFTFETDKFSTYALAYADDRAANTPSAPGSNSGSVAPSEPDTDPESGANPESGTVSEPGAASEPSSPKTGDNSMMYLWIALLFISSLGILATSLFGKKTN